jgi:hypothetical protein
MAVFTRKTLVLRGVSVLCGGESINLRLGTGYTADRQIPTVGHPMPHPMPVFAPLVNRPDWQCNCQSADANVFTDRLREDESGMQGTGRSPGQAGGAAVRRFLSTSTRSRIPGTRTSVTAGPARGSVPGTGSKATKPTGRLADAAGIA